MIVLMAIAMAAGQAAPPPQRPRMDQPHRMGPGQRMEPGQRMDRMFDMADTDRNGQISRAEFRSGMERMREHRREMRGARESGDAARGPKEGYPRPGPRGGIIPLR